MDNMYCLRFRIGGEVIDTFATIEEAQEALVIKETEDKENGMYTPDYYEVAEYRTYDIIFNDDCNSNNIGGEWTLEEAKNYIQCNNGTNNSYFSDYKGGVVSVFCKQTGEDVYEEIVR